MQKIEPVLEGIQGIDAPKGQTLARCHEVIDTLVRLHDYSLASPQRTCKSELANVSLAE